MRLFVDSDVVISSLLSQSGAANLLVNTDTLKLYISSLSRKELKMVVEKLHIDETKLTKLIYNKLQVIPLTESLSHIKKSFQEYVFDINDAHIVAGAKIAEAKFIITYNIKDFKIGKIKEDFDILTITPGHFLQYLRSIQ